jgi:hypothetical protein
MLIFTENTDKATSSSDFEKHYKRHCNARSNIQKAREIYERSVAQHNEIREKHNDVRKDFLELKKIVSDVSPSLLS